jgi:hypothetical protein
MDMPQLSRIDAHARVSAVARSDELYADGSRAFALIIGEDAARRRRSGTDENPAPDGDFAARSAPTPHEPAESIIEPQSLADVDEVLPEDAHDPQELRALLAAPAGEV